MEVTALCVVCAVMVVVVAASGVTCDGGGDIVGVNAAVLISTF